jgi:hypothetical protein
MNIVGKYDVTSVDFTGTADTLIYLARAIRELVVKERFSLFIPSAPPAPYLGYVKSLELERGVGKVSVSRSGESVNVSESADYLALFAHNIERLASSESCQDHLHIEFHPQHFYLNKESVPLVITKCLATE